MRKAKVKKQEKKARAAKAKKDALAKRIKRQEERVAERVRILSS